MKKVLSLVLVIAMVLSSMSFAFAGTLTDMTDNDYKKAVETLAALGVVTGYEDGTFKPEKTITRAEMAKLMVITLGYGDLVAGSKSNFSDTQGHWADAYIALAAGKGIVVGTGNGKFAPDKTVTYNEVYTMLVRGLGYTDSCNELKGMTWPTNFKVKAAELGITKDVKMATEGADRGGVAQAIYNALEAILVTVDTDGNVTNIIDKNKNGIELLSRIADLDENYNVTTDKLDPKNKNYACELVDLAPYMFQNLDVYVNDDDQVVYVKGTNSLVIDGTIDEVTVAGGVTTVAVEDANGRIQKVNFNTTAAAIDMNDVFENGAIRKTNKTYAGLEDTETIKIVATDAGSKNGKIEGSEVQGFVLTQQTKVARIEKEYVAGKTKIDTFVLPEDNDKADLENITVTGAAEKLEDVKVDDVVVEYLSEDESVTKLVVTRNTVKGKVTRVDGSAKVYVDGKLYELNTTKGAYSGLVLGDEGIFFLDQDGKIADYDGEAAGPVNYAVVKGVADGTTTNRFGFSIDKYPQLKLATKDNESIVYDIQVKMDSAGVVSGSAKYTNATTTAAILNGNLSVSGITAGNLIKYTLNSDGKISKVTVVTSDDLRTTSSSVFTNVDLDLAKNAFASNAIVFDASDDDFDVVDKSALPSELDAYVVRNSRGEIEVLVAMDGEIRTGAETVYAYINKVNASYDSKGNEVQTIVVYTDGQKKEIQTDAISLVTNGTKNAAYSFKYKGELIDDSTIAVATTGQVATVTAINAQGKMIQLNIGGSVNWYSMSDHGTIVGIDPTVDSTPNSVNGIRDLYDIDVNDSITVYLNSPDREVDLIVIAE